MITWAERIANLTAALGRKPTLNEMLEVAEIHQMTPAEIDAQRRSWIRGMTARCNTANLILNSVPIAGAGVNITIGTRHERNAGDYFNSRRRAYCLRSYGASSSKCRGADITETRCKCIPDNVISCKVGYIMLKKIICWYFGHDWILVTYDDGPRPPWTYENRRCARCDATHHELVASKIG